MDDETRRESRRADFDLVARLADKPHGATVIFEGVGYVNVQCPNCQCWYWRKYHQRAALAKKQRLQKKPMYCSDECSLSARRRLHAARQQEYSNRRKARDADPNPEMSD